MKEIRSTYRTSLNPGREKPGKTFTVREKKGGRLFGVIDGDAKGEGVRQ